MNLKSPTDATIWTYKDLIESFFTKNYPNLEKEMFWKWFNNLLIGKKKDITELTAKEQIELISKLNELGDKLFDTRNYPDSFVIKDFKGTFTEPHS